MILVKAGDPLYLNLQLESRLTDKYVRAELRDHLGADIAGSPVNLAHTTDGLYVNSSILMPSKPFIIAVYKVYDDDQYTTISDDDFYQQSEFVRDTTEQTQIVDAVKAEIDDSDTFEGIVYDDDCIDSEIDDDDYIADVSYEEEYEAVIEDNDHYQGEIKC